MCVFVCSVFSVAPCASADNEPNHLVREKTSNLCGINSRAKVRAKIRRSSALAPPGHRHTISSEQTSPVSKTRRLATLSEVGGRSNAKSPSRRMLHGWDGPNGGRFSTRKESKMVAVTASAKDVKLPAMRKARVTLIMPESIPLTGS